MLRDDQIKVDVGRVDEGSFVRVTHLPTGRSRAVGPLKGEAPQAVVARLRNEIEAELRGEGLLES
jgi:hypothetical protein